MTEFEKALIVNSNLNDLLAAIAERDDIDVLVKKFQSNNVYNKREYMTVKQFAEYLQSTIIYARDLAKRAEKQHLFEIAKVGRDYRIDRISYEKWRMAGGN